MDTPHNAPHPTNENAQGQALAPEYKRSRSWQDILNERRSDDWLTALDELWDYCHDRADIDDNGGPNKYMRWEMALTEYLEGKPTKGTPA